MTAFDFVVVAAGLDPMAPDFEDRFFEAGCDDASIAWQEGSIVVDFTREAPSFEEAVTSAIRDVERAGARVERIEPDDLVVHRLADAGSVPADISRQAEFVRQTNDALSAATGRRIA